MSASIPPLQWTRTGPSRSVATYHAPDSIDQWHLECRHQLPYYGDDLWTWMIMPCDEYGPGLISDIDTTSATEADAQAAAAIRLRENLAALEADRKHPKIDDGDDDFRDHPPIDEPTLCVVVAGSGPEAVFVEIEDGNGASVRCPFRRRADGLGEFVIRGRPA